MYELQGRWRGGKGLDKAEIVEVLRSLARKSRFITVSDLCAALQLAEEDCLSLLDEYVQQGLLRSTQSTQGHAYYWLTSQLATE